MARVLALIPDLLFGSRIQSSLTAVGYEVELISDPTRLTELIGDSATSEPTVLVVDLTDPDLDGPALVQELFAGDEHPRVRTLGFYAHVDVAMRERAQHAGFDLVVPRSRMARESVAIVSGLVS